MVKLLGCSQSCCSPSAKVSLHFVLLISATVSKELYLRIHVDIAVQAAAALVGLAKNMCHFTKTKQKGKQGY